MSDTDFTGSIPATYDDCLVPLLFAPFAAETARRSALLGAHDILETAAGTGIVSQALAESMPGAAILATDLNPAMLDVAAARVEAGNVRFQPADALDLPFEDGAFDLVVCQFGAMFFPDRVKGAAEARRVLRPGGKYLSVIWDSLDSNPVSKAMSDCVKRLFPDDPPLFMERVPFGYADPSAIESDLRSGGFGSVKIDRVTAFSRVNSKSAARGMCAGSPLSLEIAERDPNAADRVAEAVCAALEGMNGREMPMSALYATATA